MATLSFGVSGPTQQWTVTMAIADNDSPRILAYLCSPASGYGMVRENVVSEIPDPAWSPGEGQSEADRPMIEVQQWVERPATMEEAAKAFADATLKGLLSATISYEQAQAAAAAAAAVPPITPISA